jgi:hypothetical protein
VRRAAWCSYPPLPVSKFRAFFCAKPFLKGVRRMQKKRAGRNSRVDPAYIAT